MSAQAWILVVLAFGAAAFLVERTQRGMSSQGSCCEGGCECEKKRRN